MAEELSPRQKWDKKFAESGLNVPQALNLTDWERESLGAAGIQQVINNKRSARRTNLAAFESQYGMRKDAGVHKVPMSLLRVGGSPDEEVYVTTDQLLTARGQEGRTEVLEYDAYVRNWEQWGIAGMKPPKFMEYRASKRPDAEDYLTYSWHWDRMSPADKTRLPHKTYPEFQEYIHLRRAGVTPAEAAAKTTATTTAAGEVKAGQAAINKVWTHTTTDIEKELRGEMDALGSTLANDIWIQSEEIADTTIPGFHDLPEMERDAISNKLQKQLVRDKVNEQKEAEMEAAKTLPDSKLIDYEQWTSDKGLRGWKVTYEKDGKQQEKFVRGMQ